LCLLAVCLLTGCGALAAAFETQTAAPAVPPELLVPRVVSERPHDTGSFTQGLVWDDGRMYESAGQYGLSNLREVDPLTGEVLRRVEVPPEYFAEGLAQVDDRLIQITWREGTAFVYDAASFERVGEFSYTGEGWGLCYDGTHLVMSDGSDTLTIRDAATFEALEQIPVRFNDQPVTMLNELECVGEHVYANVWQTDFIVRIDPTTGVVTGVIDATGLLPPETRATLQSGAVLNGIAYDPATERFYITGKLWPTLFEVEFVPAG
jgi:glutamine cyclotransferase